MDEVLNFLKEAVQPLTGDMSIPETDRKILTDGYQTLLDETIGMADRVHSSSDIFLSINSYLKMLINRIETIVLPLTEDVTVENADAETFKLIVDGYSILTDNNIELKDRIQLSCDKFDIAQYKPYNPYHSRVILARAIATREYSFGGKEFQRTKKSELSD